MKEVYFNAAKDMLLVEDLATGEVIRMDQMSRSFIVNTDRKILDMYPDQHAELAKLVGNDCCEYGRVYQFMACNFSSQDGQPDIDDDGNFVFERVSCPIRHNCKRTTCSPRVSGKLSARELQVVVLFAKGFAEEEIGERLFISRSTAHNHITHIYQKLNLTGGNPDRQLMAYAFKNKIC